MHHQWFSNPEGWIFLCTFDSALYPAANWSLVLRSQVTIEWLDSLFVASVMGHWFGMIGHRGWNSISLACTFALGLFNGDWFGGLIVTRGSGSSLASHFDALLFALEPLSQVIWKPSSVGWEAAPFPVSADWRIGQGWNIMSIQSLTQVSFAPKSFGVLGTYRLAWVAPSGEVKTGAWHRILRGFIWMWLYAIREKHWELVNLTL